MEEVEFISCIPCIMFIFMGCIMTHVFTLNYLRDAFIYSAVFKIFGELLSRCVILIREFKNKRTLWDLAKKVYSFNAKSQFCIAVVLSIFLFMSRQQEYFLSRIEDYGVISFIFMFLAVNELSSAINLQQCPYRSTKMNGLDYGSGLAYSYYYGYLDLILPCRGDERQGLKDQMMIFERKHDVSFAKHKIYILIPSSGYCPSTLGEQSGHLESCGNLEPKYVHRAGSQNRKYALSVYKLYKSENEFPQYICAEYASPLLTFYKVKNQNKDSKYIQENYGTIIKNFYRTLKKLMNEDRSIYNLCELIYYEDTDDDGQFIEVDVGKLILNRLKMKKKNTRC